jgi:uncharacterized protein (TIGR04255 family)
MTGTEDVTDETVLPNFDHPPVVEVALGIQFQPIAQLRPIELGSLRDRWRADYPSVQEQPALSPTTEGQPLGAPAVQLVLGPVPQTRLWFTSADLERLVQLQPDRLVVNWRKQADGNAYPRFPTVRAEFERKLRDLDAFVAARGWSRVMPDQIEITYINAIELPDDRIGELDRFVKSYQPVATHHLGSPEQAQMSLVYPVPALGRAPVRLYVALNPAKGPRGEAAIFMTLTLRGAPSGDSIESALEFLDGGHQHIVRSFAELTSETMHAEWGMRR